MNSRFAPIACAAVLLASAAAVAPSPASACSAPPYATLTVVNKTPWALYVSPVSSQKSVWGCSSNGPNFPSQCQGTNSNYRQSGSIDLYGTVNPNGGTIVASDDERWPNDGWYNVNINFRKTTAQWPSQHAFNKRLQIPQNTSGTETADGWTAKVNVELFGFDSDCAQDRFVVTISQ